MAALYSYIACGLGISSDLLLPEMLEGKKKADVKIKRGVLDPFLRSPIEEERHFRATKSEVYRSYANIGSVLIIQGREIIVDLASGTDEQLLRPYLLGEILGILLHQRGLLILHGSAVALNG
jgi:hypothetical protein